MIDLHTCTIIHIICILTVYVSHFHFGLYKGVHLVEVAASPHHPHRQSSHNEGHQSNPTYINYLMYFWFSHYFPGGDCSATYLSTFQPTSKPRISQIMLPINTGCIPTNINNIHAKRYREISAYTISHTHNQHQKCIHIIYQTTCCCLFAT